MRRVSSIIQLLVALSIVGLFWLIYPGSMVIVATGVALVYVAAAVGALRGPEPRVAFAALSRGSAYR